MGARLASGIFSHGFDKLALSKAESLFELSAQGIDGKKVSFEDWKGKKKAFLVVNFSTKTGVSKQKMKEIKELYQTYESQGLEVFGFPCLSFQMPEVGTEEYIRTRVRNKYQLYCPLFEKVYVNGPSTSPVYQFLRTRSTLFNP